MGSSVWSVIAVEVKRVVQGYSKKDGDVQPCAVIDGGLHVEVEEFGE